MRTREEINNILFKDHSWVRDHPDLIKLELLLDIRDLLISQSAEEAKS